MMEVNSILDNHDLRVEGREQPGTKEAREERQCSVESQSMPEDGLPDFLNHT